MQQPAQLYAKRKHLTSFGKHYCHPSTISDSAITETQNRCYDVQVSNDTEVQRTPPRCDDGQEEDNADDDDASSQHGIEEQDEEPESRKVQ